MAVVKVNGIERSYPEGTTYLEIARDFQDQYENDILLVRVNGKLRELEKTLAGDSEISFITAKENAGYKTYERSAIFLMLKAFYEVVQREKIRKIIRSRKIRKRFLKASYLNQKKKKQKRLSL